MSDNSTYKTSFSYNTRSNVLRLYLLYKYGGTYVDMDHIVLKKFSDTPNHLGAETIDSIGTASQMGAGGGG